MSRFRAMPALPGWRLLPLARRRRPGPPRHRSRCRDSEPCRLCRDRGYSLRPAAGGGGPEGKLRGRPPPPVEPRSGPWRRTGSEFDAGRAQTRRELSMTDAAVGGPASDAKRRGEVGGECRIHRLTQRGPETCNAWAEADRREAHLPAVDGRRVPPPTRLPGAAEPYQKACLIRPRFGTP